MTPARMVKLSIMRVQIGEEWLQYIMSVTREARLDRAAVKGLVCVARPRRFGWSVALAAWGGECSFAVSDTDKTSSPQRPGNSRANAAPHCWATTCGFWYVIATEWGQ